MALRLPHSARCSRVLIAGPAAAQSSRITTRMLMALHPSTTLQQEAGPPVRACMTTGKTQLTTGKPSCMLQAIPQRQTVASKAVLLLRTTRMSSSLVLGQSLTRISSLAVMRLGSASQTSATKWQHSAWGRADSSASGLQIPQVPMQGHPQQDPRSAPSTSPAASAKPHTVTCSTASTVRCRAHLSKLAHLV